MLKARINKIIDSSVVDGPGNRTAIFFQSCNFNCRYCHNPETIHMCRNCGICVDHCPKHALFFKDKEVVWNEMDCCGCDTCIHICPFSASPKTKEMTVEEVWKQIEKNLPFIRGITVSGGECTLQAEFVIELFRIAKGHGLTALLDSNGSYAFKEHPEILEVSDGVMLDVKADCEQKHQWLTGHSIDIVLENLSYLAGIGKLEEIRTVCIPEILNNERTIELAAEILSPYLQQQNIRYKLIRYRPFGVREEYRNYRQPDDAYMNQLKDLAYLKGFRDIVII